MLLYWLTKVIFGVFAKIFLRLKVEGRENLPTEGGFILAANHASSLDPFMIMSAVPHYIRWMVIYEYYDLGHLRWLLKRMRFIRTENNLPKNAFYALRQGEIIGAFPEGRRTWDGHLGQAKPGVAALARKTSSPVVPVAVLGTFAALPRTRKRLKFCPITVRIGKPLFFSQPTDKKENAEADRRNIQRLMGSIGELMRR